MHAPADGMLVTIAIPTYNSADRYLTSAIESALSQDYRNLEIIISDNASTDHTSEVVHTFDDERLRYVRHAVGLGPNGNFNYCVDAAKGDYMLLLHDDDLIDEDFVSSCVEMIDAAGNPSFVRTGTRIIDADGNVVRRNTNIVEGHTPEALYRSWFKYKTAVYYCSTFFKTTALREIGGFHSPYNQLQDGYAIALLAPRQDWADVQDVKASFRLSPGQLTYSVPVKEWCGDFAGLLDIMCDQVDGDVDAFRAEGRHFFGRLSRSRAQKQATRFSRMTAGVTVARYFGPRYFPWGRLRSFARLLPSRA